MRYSGTYSVPKNSFTVLAHTHTHARAREAARVHTQTREIPDIFLKFVYYRRLKITLLMILMISRLIPTQYQVYNQYRTTEMTKSRTSNGEQTHYKHIQITTTLINGVYLWIITVKSQKPYHVRSEHFPIIRMKFIMHLMESLTDTNINI